MSYTTIPPEVRLKVWVRAGGRCEYLGCNDNLWRDELTLREMNKAYLAHIVADSPNGPRGDATLSEQLKADPSNIMLLCDTHHRLVDREDVAGHPAKLLRRYKREHEERIERQTGIQTNRRTHLVLFGTRIGDRQGDVNYEQACAAVLDDERYPADEKGIRLDLTDNEVCEDDPEFWAQTAKFVERRLRGYLKNGVGPSGKPLNHLSIFALAPIPTLIHFGKQLGDLVSADVYQRHRDTNDWRWKALGDECFDYNITRPHERCAPHPRIAVNLSLSGTIHPSEVERAMGTRAPTYMMTIGAPNRNFLRSKEQLELFRSAWCRLLSEIRRDHGESCELHLFAAVPTSVAIEIGRSLLPKSDPALHVYDNDRERGGFVRAMVV